MTNSVQFKCVLPVLTVGNGRLVFDCTTTLKYTPMSIHSNIWESASGKAHSVSVRYGSPSEPLLDLLAERKR